MWWAERYNDWCTCLSLRPCPGLEQCPTPCYFVCRWSFGWATLEMKCTGLSLCTNRFPFPVLPRVKWRPCVGFEHAQCTTEKLVLNCFVMRISSKRKCVFCGKCCGKNKRLSYVFSTSWKRKIRIGGQNTLLFWRSLFWPKGLARITNHMHLWFCSLRWLLSIVGGGGNLICGIEIHILLFQVHHLNGKCFRFWPPWNGSSRVRAGWVFGLPLGSKIQEMRIVF